MKKILIIEDDEVVATIYRKKMTAEGYAVDVAGDGAQGLEKIRAGRPDLVIVDLIIPEVPGVEVIKHIRSNPETSQLPIVVLSNTYLSNTIKDAWKAGATSCLSKASCTPNHVLEVVRNAMTTGHQPHRGLSATATQMTTPRESATTEKADPAAAKQSEMLAAQSALLTKAAGSLVALRSALQTLIRTENAEERAKILNEMLGKAHGLTGAAAVGLTRISQLADAFEALLKEMHDKPKNINPSTLRTAASALDFFGVLIKSGKAAENRKSVSPNVLVVDDELLSRRAVTHALERVKLQAQDVDDPFAALKRLTEENFDLVFLDADMPGMNGFELCAKIRTIPHHEKTPVVFVTALNDFEARTNSTMAGANDFIGKPFPFIELAVKALIYVLRGRVDPKK